jgi:hypothetical protein
MASSPPTSARTKVFVSYTWMVELPDGSTARVASEVEAVNLVKRSRSDGLFSYGGLPGEEGSPADKGWTIVPLHETASD